MKMISLGLPEAAPRSSRPSGRRRVLGHLACATTLILTLSLTVHVCAATAQETGAGTEPTTRELQECSLAGLLVLSAALTQA